MQNRPDFSHKRHPSEIRDSPLAELPIFLEQQGKLDTEVPTLHLDKIPLVETLGRTRDPADLSSTRPAPTQPQSYPTAIPAVAPDSGAIKSMAAADSAAALDDGAEGARPRLVVLRGEKLNMVYAIYPGKNYLGRTDDKPVDIDLENQEPPDRIWTSRQHAVIMFENSVLTIEDPTEQPSMAAFVNRHAVHPGCGAHRSRRTISFS